MESGWDPDIKRYFRKVLNSFSLGLLWLMSSATAGIYFKLAYCRPIILPVIFYTFMLGGLVLFLWYMYRTWKKG